MLGAPETPPDSNLLRLGEKKQQFKNVRRVGYGILAVVILVSVYLAYVEGGGSSNPSSFYLPLPQLMFVLLLGALLLNLTSVVFGALEVKAASSGEQRYLIARHGYSTGLVTAAFAVFFFIVIAALGPVIDSQIDYDHDLELGVLSSQNTVTAPFDVASDYTGSSYLSWVEINSKNGNAFNVSVYPHDAQYNESSSKGTLLIQAINVTHFRLDFVLGKVETTPVGNWTNKGWSNLTGAPETLRYVIVLERKDSAPAQINYHQDRQLDPGFVGSVYVLLLLLVAINGGAAVYNYFVRQKWRAYGEKNY